MISSDISGSVTYSVSWENTSIRKQDTQKEGDCASLRTMYSAVSQQAVILTCIGFTSKGLVSWAQAVA